MCRCSPTPGWRTIRAGRRACSERNRWARRRRCGRVVRVRRRARAAAPGYAGAPRGGPRGWRAGRRRSGGARARWGAPSRVSNPSVRGCAPCVQFVPQPRYPECVSRERILRVVRTGPARRRRERRRRAERPVRPGGPSADRTAVALVPLAHVLPPLGDVWSSPAHAAGVAAVRPCGGRSYGCTTGAHQGSHEDTCAGVRSQSSGREGTGQAGSGRQCCQPSENGAPQARITSTAQCPACLTCAAS